MRVEAKFVFPEASGLPGSGDYDIPEGAAVSDLLEAGREVYGDRIPENAGELLIFLRNGMPAQIGTKLSEGDKIHILRKIYGG